MITISYQVVLEDSVGGGHKLTEETQMVLLNKIKTANNTHSTCTSDYSDHVSEMKVLVCNNLICTAIKNSTLLQWDT